MARAGLLALGLLSCGRGADEPPLARVPTPPAVVSPKAAPSAAAPQAELVVERAPAASAVDVLPDTPFRLRFVQPVRLGRQGFVRLIRHGSSTPSDSIDVAQAVRTETIAGREFRVERPVRMLDDRTAEIRFRPGALEPSADYAVTVDDGAFITETDTPVTGLADARLWRVTTRNALDAARTDLVVSSDGRGDFFTLQGAVDSTPPGRPLSIRVKEGTYFGITLIVGRSDITLKGDGIGRTVLTYPNNEILQEKRGSAYRAVLGLEDVSGVVIEDLTVRNTTPQGGSQAEALRVDPGDRVVLRNAEFISRQDTLLLTGRVYAERCRVEGNVDYVWGKGTAYFSDCEFHVVGREGWEVQARNPADKYGYVFVDSRLTAEPGISGHRLARIDATRFPASQVAYVDCRMGDHVAPEGFLVTPPGAPTTGVRFWEAGSRDLSGRPLDMRRRDPASRRLAPSEAKRLRDRSVVLGGWVP